MDSGGNMGRMKSAEALRRMAYFLFYLGLGIVIPDLTIEFFNFQQYSLEIKMVFVAATGILGIAHLLMALGEVSPN